MPPHVAGWAQRQPKRFQRRFTLDRMLDGVERVYQEILARRSRVTAVATNRAAS
jgi:hypothetical protein